MRILLDTHMLIWALEDSKRMPADARRLIDNHSYDVFLSVVSLWEVQIKHRNHPDRMPVSGEELYDLATLAGYKCLPLNERHILALSSLVYAEGRKPHHDPFDRAMLCQAKVEDMRFLTHDSLLRNYLEPCLLYV